MSQEVRRTAAAAGRLLRKALPARGWRRYATGGFVLALGVSGTIAAVSAQPAQAAHKTYAVASQPASQAASQAAQCVVPPSPTLAGFRQGQVKISDDSIHYVIGGSGPAIVLIHGWPMTWSEFTPIMPDLAKTHTVIALDLPGLGNSAVPTTGGYTVADAATRLHAAVTALGYSNVSIIAHDLGVGIGYAYARLYPSSVTRLMVMESELNGFGLEAIFGESFHFGLNMAASPTPERIINNREAEVAYLNFLYDFAKNPADITAADRKAWYGAYSCPQEREAGYNYYRAMGQDATWDTQNATPKLAIPVVGMGGDDSFGTSTATSMANVDTDVHTVVVPNSGHYIPEENPAFLNECANLFFGANQNPTIPAGFEGCTPS